MSEGGADRAWRRTLLVVALSLVASALVTVLVDPHLRGPGAGPGMHRPVAQYLQVRLFVSTFNVLVLLALTGNYVRVYRDIPTRFTGSLLLFSVALLLYALSANPAIQLAFGFRAGPGLGPFTFLPDLFASVAAAVLLHQSYR
ncbi:MAG: hypothetical protein ABEJ77_01590 [Halanaeroarchaeum sp.]